MTAAAHPGPAPSAVVARLFSAAVGYELWGAGDETALHPEEAALVAGAVVNRRQQFAAGRACAHRGLDDLAVPNRPLLVGEQRSPRWPDGVTGSISHTDGYAVAVVAKLPAAVTPDAADTSAASAASARGGLVRTLGVDAEQVGRVSHDLHERLFLDTERAWLAAMPAAEQAAAATVMFGAKEAFYKAQYPCTGAWVGFHDVELRPDGDDLTLHPATDLAALHRFEWPLRARSVVRRGIAVIGVEAVSIVP